MQFQDKCIQFMIHSLNDPKQFVVVSTTYLNADMIQFLCEPLLTISSSLLQYRINNKYALFNIKFSNLILNYVSFYFRSICLCVWMLSKNNKFYERNDALYTCNSILRTLVFLIKTGDPSISDLIQLLAIIIKKYAFL